MLIKSIPPNPNGKDYICSDIHGHFYILDQQLRDLNFDKSSDRLFCLGDLIDRGDESFEVLGWLAQPWFFAIQGNHERMLINAFESDSNVLWQQWMMWGGAWAEDLSREEIEPFYQELKTLPVAMEISLNNKKRVGLIHAELPDMCDWAELRCLLTNKNAEDIESNQIISDLLWSKSQPFLSALEIPRIDFVKGIDHVFHGHTIVEDYLTITNRTFMDLGSYESGKIGLIEASTFLDKLST